MIPRSEHPRPDFQRDSWLNLNGDWQFAFEGDCPTPDPANPKLTRTITVPFSWAAPLSGVAEDRKGLAWYSRTCRFDRKGQDLALVIGASDYITDVYVNGAYMGNHVGGYDEFSFDVSDVWHDNDDNLIFIAVRDDDKDCQTRGKQGYGEIRGLWQTVYLQAYPKAHIDSFWFETELDGKVTVHLSALSDKEQALPLCLNFGENASLCTTAALKTGLTEWTEVITVSNPHLWNCDDPYLYEGTITLGEDAVHTYFGIRTVGTGFFDGNPYVTINGKPVYLNGTLDQSFNPKGYFTLPTEQDVIDEVKRLKALDLNLVRLHIKPEEPRKLYWLDKLGVLVWADMVCFWGDPTAEAMAQHEKELFGMIRRDRTHPSIIAWIIFNETWGLFTHYENGSRAYTPETQEQVRAVYHRVKACDPTRLAEDNSPCNYDHVETDINTWHFYLNTYPVVRDHLRTAVEGTFEGSGWNYIAKNTQTAIPLINSECGMVWGVDGSAGDSDIAWHYHYMLNEYRLHSKIDGFVFTEFHDVINEFNGYYRINNDPKDFGYQSFCRDMTVADLHSQRFVATNCAPCQTVGGNEIVDIPLVYSCFEKPESKLTLDWEFWYDSLNGPVVVQKGSMPVCGNGYGSTSIGNLRLTTPDAAALCVLSLYLSDETGIISRNFTTLDVRGAVCGLAVRPADYTQESFPQTWASIQNARISGAESGSFTYQVDVSSLIEKKPQTLEIVFEASSRRILQKDGSNDNVKPPVDLGFMHGYRMDPGTNRNSYFMTDSTTCPTTVRVYAEDQLIAEQLLENAPCDSRGVLSWHYQPVIRLLDDAGSYGYLVRARLEGEALQKLAANDGKLNLRIEGDGNGLALYGRNCGRYPIDILIRAI